MNKDSDYNYNADQNIDLVEKCKYKIYEDLTKKQTNCCSNKFEFCFNKRIYRIKPNTFFYTKFYFIRYLVIYFIIGALFAPMMFFYSDDNNNDITLLIVPPIVLIITVVFSCFVFLDNYFIVDSNTFTIMKKALCRKKVRTYFFGELDKIDLESPVSDNEKKVSNQVFNFYLIKTSGEKELLCRYCPNSKISYSEVDMESVNDFLNDINSLIIK